MNTKLTGVMFPDSRYVLVGDDMTWPSGDLGDLEWELRYGSEECIINQRMVLASVVHAYERLMTLSQQRRNAICGAIHGARVQKKLPPTPTPDAET